MSANDRKRTRDRVLSRLGNDFVNYTAPAIERSVVRGTKFEIRGAVYVFVHRSVGKGRYCRSDRRRDHLIALRDRRVEGSTTIEIGAIANINGFDSF